MIDSQINWNGNTFTMTDTPKEYEPVQFELQTCFTCRAGADKDRIYGCVTWGFELMHPNVFGINLTNVLVMVPGQPGFMSGPSAQFLDAVSKWNKQPGNHPLPTYSPT